MTEPKWLSRKIVDAIQFDQLQQHGGSAGCRDVGALESALARPLNKLAYEPESDLASLAAAYGYGLATNHAYVDGNKRVAFMAMYAFLGLNGQELEATQAEVVDIMLAVADGRLGETELAACVREHVEDV
jgi:death-on-curing protein